MADATDAPKMAVKIDPDTGKQLLLVLGLGLELVMMAAGLWPAAWLVLRYAPVARTPGHWVGLILGAVLVFNVGYLVALLVLRLVIPRPRQGYHAFSPDGKVPVVFTTFLVNVLLVKARYEPPWAAMFSSVLTQVPPLGPLFRRFFGPRTRSVSLGDVAAYLDPHYLEVGRHVEIGYGCTIIAHHFDNRGLYIRKVTIGDHAVIGGETTLMAGVEVGHHAVVGNRSVVKANTRIAPYEYWAGVPAKKIKDIQCHDSPEPGETSA